jgi:hypothetical protein
VLLALSQSHSFVGVTGGDGVRSYHFHSLGITCGPLPPSGLSIQRSRVQIPSSPPLFPHAYDARAACALRKEAPDSPISLPDACGDGRPDRRHVGPRCLRADVVAGALHRLAQIILGRDVVPVEDGARSVWWECLCWWVENLRDPGGAIPDSSLLTLLPPVGNARLRGMYVA